MIKNTLCTLNVLKNGYRRILAVQYVEKLLLENQDNKLLGRLEFLTKHTNQGRSHGH